LSEVASWLAIQMHSQTSRAVWTDIPLLETSHDIHSVDFTMHRRVYRTMDDPVLSVSAIIKFTGS